MTVAEPMPAVEDVPARRKGLCCRSFRGECALYDPAHDTVHYLNRTAYFIWRHCDSRHSVQVIADGVADAFEVDVGDDDPHTHALADVQHTLAELADNGLIEFVDQQVHEPARDSAHV